MCGIIGYVGPRDVRDVVLRGLRNLEYRGYDSAGLSLLADGEIESVRAVGNLAALHAAIDQRAPVSSGERPVALAARPATAGIGHTRWATHGRVSEDNAHPHHDGDERVHVVVNGIVENYVALRDRLLAGGARFRSQTDAEVIAHLVAHHMDGDLVEAVRRAYAELEGHFAFVAMSAEHPDTLVAARLECPLIVGRGEGEQFVASALPAFLAHTRDVQYIENGELVVLRRDGVQLIRPQDGGELERPVVRIEWDVETAEKGGFETFMLKEIHEQPGALADDAVRPHRPRRRGRSGRGGAFDERCWTGCGASSSWPAAPRCMPG